MHPQLSFHHDSWEEEEVEPDLTLEDSWQKLLENPEVNTHTHKMDEHAYILISYFFNNGRKDGLEKSIWYG